MGCYGNPFVRTPNLDQLAETGVLFSHFYTQSPLCAPIRGSFLTGRYPRTTRLRQNGQNGQNIPPEEALVTRLLADAGYICDLAGKLHITASGAEAGLIAESVSMMATSLIIGPQNLSRTGAARATIRPPMSTPTG